MVIDIILIILGIILCSMGLFFLIIYLNLLTMGYSFLEFGQFIIRNPYMYLIPLGIILISIGLERKKINEFLLRHHFRLFRK